MTTWRAYVGDGTFDETWPGSTELDESGLDWHAAAAKVLARLTEQPDEPDCPGCQRSKDRGLEALRSGQPQRVFAEVDGVVFVVAPDGAPTEKETR